MSSMNLPSTDDEAASLLWSLAIHPAAAASSATGNDQSQQAGSQSNNAMASDGPLRDCLSTLAPKQLVQMIMRCLGFNEIFQLARCNRALMTAADDPFAWGMSTRFYMHKLSSSTLPRASSFKHARVHFTWWNDTSDFSLDPVFVDARQLARLLDATSALGPNLFEFTASAFDLSRDQWHQLLVHPSFQFLRVLQISFTQGPPNEETFVLLSKLQSLTELRFCDHKQPASGEREWAHLANLPHLRSLYFTDAPCGKLASRLSIAARCPQLRKLECAEPRVYGAGSFIAALSGLLRLEHLHFRSLFLQGSADGKKSLPSSGGPFPASVMPPTPHELGQAFAAMEALTTLELESCEALDALLPSLVHAPSLRRLIIQPSGYGVTTIDSPVVCCSPEVAAALLHACPSLSISILLREERLWDHWGRVFKDARVLDGARAAGRFETVDKCFHLNVNFGTAGFGAASTTLAPVTATGSASALSFGGATSWGVPLDTAAGLSSSALGGVGLNWGTAFAAAAGSSVSTSSSSAWSTGADTMSGQFAEISPANWSLSAPSSSSGAWGSTAAGSSSSFFGSPGTDALFSTGSASAFGSLSSSALFSSSEGSSGGFGWGSGSRGGFGLLAAAAATDPQSSKPFSFSAIERTAPASMASSWTASSRAPTFSFTGFGAGNVEPAASGSAVQSSTAPPFGFVGPDAPITVANTAAENLDLLDDLEDDV